MLASAIFSSLSRILVCPRRKLPRRITEKSGGALCSILLAVTAIGNGGQAALGAHPFDTSRRIPWTSGNLQGSPDAADPYVTERAFAKLDLFEPLSVGLVPGSNRFGVATRPGKVFTFAIDPEISRADLLLDINKTTYGVVFHPQFATNGYFYVTYLLDPAKEDPAGSRLSRFTASRGPTPVADPSTEQVIFTWPTGGHNGGCMRFGPDGYLYLATGDSSGIADGLLTGQDISDVSGAILRIDVDRQPNGRSYAIPADNPFATTPNARGEIWSFGHRQIWKFSFDEQRRLWAGEVGQDLWEMVYLIQKGGNYGWSVREGNHPFRPERPKGPGDFVAPIVEHPHSDFRSITGGYISHSKRLPELDGAYVYGDYDTGKLWSLRYDNGKVTSHRQLADTQLRIVEFAQDRSGEVYVVDFAGGGFHRLVHAPPQVAPTKPFPRKLSETGLFASTREHLPAPGVIPYSVNAPLWSDGAEKERFIALPGDSKIEMDDVIYPHGADYPDVGWRFPNGTVLVKTFSLALDASRPNDLHRLETRLLRYRQMPGNDDEYGAQYWDGYTYVWNQEQTDATLLDASGADREFTIHDPTSPGGVRKQLWHFPSRAECALCHTMASKYVLGATTLQMNKVHDYGAGHLENQLAMFARLGLFQNGLAGAHGPDGHSQLPALVDYRDRSQPVHLRARAYLHANCAHCHRKWGGGNAEFELLASVPLTMTMAVDTRPGQGGFGLTDPRIIAPGEPDRSLILKRMQLEGLGRMPHIASKIVDREATSLLREWIAQLRSPTALDLPGAVRPRVPQKKP